GRTRAASGSPRPDDPGPGAGRTDRGGAGPAARPAQRRQPAGPAPYSAPAAHRGGPGPTGRCGPPGLAAGVGAPLGDDDDVARVGAEVPPAGQHAARDLEDAEADVVQELADLVQRERADR